MSSEDPLLRVPLRHGKGTRPAHVFALLDDLCLANNRISDRGCSTLLGVLLAPPAVQQVCRWSIVGAPRDLLSNAFDEPKMARTRPSSHASAQPPPSDPHPDVP